MQILETTASIPQELKHPDPDPDHTDPDHTDPDQDPDQEEVVGINIDLAEKL